ncbi:HD domain-containing protein [Thermococcus sp.]|uniref:HD domain-containing protein n=1 Tax=Thermococcus sp. TaxID=35749 RepID=UPI0034418F3C
MGVQDLVNALNQSLSTTQKLELVEAFLQSGDAEYVLDRCPKLWTKINDYYDLLHNKFMKKEILENVMINLLDPLRSEEEKIKLKSLEAELVKYIEGLDKRIKDIEKQILDIIQNNPNCMPRVPSAVQAPTIGIPPINIPQCPEFEKFLDQMEGIVRIISTKLSDSPFGTPWIMAHLGFVGYTDHGINHAKRVFDNAKKIAREIGANLNPLEISILKIAVYYHDYAMNFLPNVVKKNLQNLDRNALRKGHASFSAHQWINDFDSYYKILLEKYITSNHDLQKIKDAVAEIIENHSGDFNHYTDKSITICNSNIPIRVGLLSALLRLADEIDAGYYRLPQSETLGVILVLGLCYDEYAKSLPHYVTNALIDSISVENGRLEVLMHPFEGAALFYPRIDSKKVLITYKGDDLDLLRPLFNVSGKRVYAVKDMFEEKLESELELANEVFRNYSLRELGYHVEESIPLDLASRFDRDLAYRGFQSFVKMGIGKTLLDSCEDLKEIKSEHDIYEIVEVR